MAIAPFANASCFDIVDPPNLPEKEKEILIRHLIFSANLKRLWKCGDAILEGIFNRKRRRRRLLHDKLLRKVVRVIRRFAKYEVLRSCLEGLIFDEIEHLEDGDVFYVEDEPLTLTQIYFCTSAWDTTKYDKEIVFDTCDEITSQDYLKLLYFFNMVEETIMEIKVYMKTTNSKWKYRVYRYLRMIKQNHKLIMALILTPSEFP